VSIVEIVAFGLFWAVLLFILLFILYLFIYSPLRVLIKRYCVWRQLRSAASPEFQPSESYVCSTGGIAVDIDRQTFAVATHSANALLEATDITDSWIHDTSMGGVVIDIDLCSTVAPHVRLQTVFSQKALRVVSLLKTFQKDAAQKHTTSEKSPPSQEVPAQVLTTSGLEQELKRFSLDRKHTLA
jgi:hypothetical protein